MRASDHNTLLDIFNTLRQENPPPTDEQLIATIRAYARLLDPKPSEADVNGFLREQGLKV
jgi:hypothetical protein